MGFPIGSVTDPLTPFAFRYLEDIKSPKIRDACCEKHTVFVRGAAARSIPIVVDQSTENIHARGVPPMSTLHHNCRPAATEVYSVFFQRLRRSISDEVERKRTTSALCNRTSTSRPAEIDFSEFCELLEEHQSADSFEFEYFVHMNDNEIMHDPETTSIYCSLAHLTCIASRSHRKVPRATA